jgi:membrane-bound serine protease (ClpP class)
MTALGVALLVIGALVVVAEAHVPTLGILGGPGVVAMTIGTVLAVGGLGGGLAVILIAAVLVAGVGVAGVGLSRRRGPRRPTRRRPELGRDERQGRGRRCVVDGAIGLVG